MANVAVVILTYNEARHLERAILSVKGFASSVHIIDSFSTDNTVAIAKSHGCEVLEHPFKNQADQFNWGLDNIVTTATWILRLDADEYIEADLAAAIEAGLPMLPENVNGVTFDRKHIFLGRWIKWGGRYPLRLLRTFRRGFGVTEQRWMDEHIFLTSGDVVHFKGGFVDHNLNDLNFFIEKHNKYATREAIELLNQKYRFLSTAEPEGSATSKQAAFKKWAKRNVYSRIPFTISSFSYFILRFIFQLGFLDGREGVAYHFLQGYWYRFLVGAKAMELETAIKHLDTRLMMKDELIRRTGLEL
jgi:glycosyltransferase involved in cell wall biosynthesis